MSNFNKSYVGEGNVILLGSEGKLYTDLAAKFTRSQLPLLELVNQETNFELISSLVESPHQATLEFDDFLFGVELYARVTEVQLVRKRHASYMISSGRCEKHGKRPYDIVIPKAIEDVTVQIGLPGSCFDDGKPHWINYNVDTLLEMLSAWYDHGVEMGQREEDLRYMKPQGTAWRGLIKMNASALKDWFKIRLCHCAQTEIKDLATKMYIACYKKAPSLFGPMGPSCKLLGYCPEIKQCAQMKGKIPTRVEALKILRESYCPNNEVE